MKPVEIPQDIWDMAKAWTRHDALTHQINIASAILAEREKCIAICEYLSTAGALDAAEHIRNSDLREQALRKLAETPKCEGCGRYIWHDLIADDEVWAKIAPQPVDGFKGGGLLCPECITDRIAHLSPPDEEPNPVPGI